MVKKSFLSTTNKKLELTPESAQSYRIRHSFVEFSFFPTTSSKTTPNTLFTIQITNPSRIVTASHLVDHLQLYRSIFSISSYPRFVSFLRMPLSQCMTVGDIHRLFKISPFDQQLSGFSMK